MAQFTGRQINDINSLLSLDLWRYYKKSIGVMEEATLWVRHLIAVKSCKFIAFFRIIRHSVDHSLRYASIERPGKQLELIVSGVTKEFLFTANIYERFEVLWEFLVKCHVLASGVNLSNIFLIFGLQLFLVKNRFCDIVKLCRSV